VGLVNVIMIMQYWCAAQGHLMSAALSPTVVGPVVAPRPTRAVGVGR
jgi:hypothetical protein